MIYFRVFLNANCQGTKTDCISNHIITITTIIIIITLISIIMIIIITVIVITPSGPPAADLVLIELEDKTAAHEIKRDAADDTDEEDEDDDVDCDLSHFMN